MVELMLATLVVGSERSSRHEIGHLLGIRHCAVRSDACKSEAGDIIALRRGKLGFSPRKRVGCESQPHWQGRKPKPEVCP